MPLEAQTLEIPFSGLDEKKAAIVRSPGMLQRARNVEFDKTGILNKRRGYQFVGVSQVVSSLPDDLVFTSCTTFRGELVLFSHNHVVGLISADGVVRTSNDTLIYRGPCNRGALKVEFISGSSYTENNGAG